MLGVDGRVGLVLGYPVVLGTNEGKLDEDTFGLDLVGATVSDDGIASGEGETAIPDLLELGGADFVLHPLFYLYLSVLLPLLCH